MDCLPIETQADKINCPKAEKYTNIFITNEPIFSTSQSESFNIFSNINLK